LLSELGTQVLEVDLFQKIKEDDSVILKFKDLFHHLITSSLGDKFIAFVVELESTLDQVVVALFKHRDGQKQLAD